MSESGEGIKPPEPEQSTDKTGESKEKAGEPKSIRELLPIVKKDALTRLDKGDHMLPEQKYKLAREKLDWIPLDKAGKPFSDQQLEALVSFIEYLENYDASTNADKNETKEDPSSEQNS